MFSILSLTGSGLILQGLGYFCALRLEMNLNLLAPRPKILERTKQHDSLVAFRG